MRNLFLFLFVFISLSSLRAQLRLPVLYDDHMVLQQQSPVPIWGWSHPSQNIEITVSWDTTRIRTKSDNTTFWAATLYTPAAGGPHTVTIKAGGETRKLEDVMVGEVWLCSGQSNMEWGMHVSGEKGMIEQVNDPNIRLFQVPKSAASTLQVKGEGDWRVCDKEAVRYFSAVAYFFGKKLNTDLNVPIGLINASWGGTPAETWVSSEKVESDPALKAAAEQQGDTRPWCPSRPGVTFNAMINPLIPFRLAGALWYQGESNTGTSSTYKQLMEQLILDWRKQFLSDFPFYFVQIAPYTYGTPGICPALREQETK
ncbi:MAG TPA: sialate O-acetylesterase, partial [Ohtaekwangia sp.]